MSVGTASVTIIGAGEYEGILERTLEFRIEPAPPKFECAYAYKTMNVGDSFILPIEKDGVASVDVSVSDWSIVGAEYIDGNVSVNAFAGGTATITMTPISDANHTSSDPISVEITVIPEGTGYVYKVGGPADVISISFDRTWYATSATFQGDWYLDDDSVAMLSNPSTRVTVNSMQIPGWCSVHVSTYVFIRPMHSGFTTLHYTFEGYEIWSTTIFVDKGSVTIPESGREFAYNSFEQSPVGSNVRVVDGAASARDAGTYTVIVEPSPDYLWEDGTSSAKTFEWSITKAQASILVDDANKLYGDEDPQFGGTVDGLCGNDDLGVSFQRAEDDATKENVGDSITITATYVENPNYDVSVTDGSLVISAKPIDEAVVKLDTSEVKYTSSEHTPNVTEVSLDDVIIDPEDYEVTYSNNVDVGAATVMVSGKGNYAGAATVTFQIVEPFADVWSSQQPGSTHKVTAHADDIAWLAAEGISTGWVAANGTATFRPLANVARADMAAFLFRLAEGWGMVDEGWQPSGTAGFVDVTPSIAHYQEIMWLAETGISAGWAMKNGTVQFRPYANVARADMAAFLFRLARLAGMVDDLWQPSGFASFRDVSASTAHYREIMWLAETGISQGWTVKGEKEFRPYANVARADMAAFLHRLNGLRE